MRRRYVTSVIAVGGAAAAYFVSRRPWQLRWGATDQESDGTLPGDDLIANPDLTATRAITVLPRPSRSGPGSPSSDRAGAASTATTRWRTWSAATSTAPTRSSPNGRTSPSGTRSSSTRRWGSPWRPSSRADRWCCAAGFRWEHLASLRLHLGLRPPGAAGRDDPAAGARALRLHPAVGAVAGRARYGGQLRDEPQDASWDQGSGRTDPTVRPTLGSAPGLRSRTPNRPWVTAVTSNAAKAGPKAR